MGLVMARGSDLQCAFFGAKNGRFGRPEIGRQWRKGRTRQGKNPKRASAAKPGGRADRDSRPWPGAVPDSVMILARPAWGAAGSGDGLTRSLPEALIDDRQALAGQPVHCLVTTREEVVAGRFFVGEL